MPAKTISSDIDIVNLALSKLGHRPIADFDDRTALKASNVARASFDLYRRSVLEQYPWDFATEFQTLTPEDTLPEDSYGYEAAFQIPGGYLKVHAVQDQASDDGNEWKVFGTLIFTNLASSDSTIKVTLIKYVSNVGIYTASFIDALAERCAAEWASTILRVSSETAALRESARDKVRDATSSDGGQGSPVRVETNATCILARRGHNPREY